MTNSYLGDGVAIPPSSREDPELDQLTGADQLSPQQRKALNEFINGETVRTVAEYAGVHRGTIYRWLQQDGPFRTALRKRRKLIRVGAREEVLSLMNMAARNVRNAVRIGDARVSIVVLKAMGLLASLETDDSVKEGLDFGTDAQPMPTLVQAEACDSRATPAADADVKLLSDQRLEAK